MSHQRPVLEQRVVTLEAQVAIEALKGRYWRAIDAGNADAVAECLVEDVKIDFEGMPTFDCSAAFLDTVREAASTPGSFHMHHGRNPVIRVDGDDSASGTWDVHYTGAVLPHRMLIRMAGRYQDVYRREDGDWRIASMTMRQTYFLCQLIDEHGVPHITAWPGGTSNDDLSGK